MSNIVCDKYNTVLYDCGNEGLKTYKEIKLEVLLSECLNYIKKCDNSNEAESLIQRVNSLLYKKSEIS